MLKSAFSVFLFCLLRRLDCTVSQHASPVQVYEGVESVLLPCQVPTNVSRNSTAVVWSRDEFTLPVVHKHQQSGADLTNQNLRYKNRTSMTVDALQTGVLSLTLRNPAYSDSGTYTCTTRKDGKHQNKTEVQLKVSERPPPPPVWPIVLAVLIPVLLLNALYGAVVYRAYKIVKNRAVCMLKAEEVTQGVDSIELPWRKDEDLPAAVRVKWTRAQPSYKKICVCVMDQETWWKIFKGLFLCGEDTAPPTDAERWRLSQMVENLDGRWTLSNSGSPNLDGRADETRHLNGQS
ncbi:uncharacterized protein LOC102082613 isoform X2 [Oreochromis niloticus]|uniref:uncharacterized protein LOC102082613 isoform X2 n=1 Tax=Oreochromis niloticus TaxID=8128 RepID=UPI000904B83C|nr:uncharacterized protein LOC102082613 isoform X2 [Oreochromis niloticus]